MSLSTPQHRVRVDQPGTRRWLPGPRRITAVRSDGTAVVKAPYARPLFWIGVPPGLDLHEGNVVFGLWHDRLIAGSYPGTSLLCVDPGCPATVVCESDDGHTWEDPYVVDGHFALWGAMELPGA
ncbi:hypothetical protein [Demequina globuliformis]|uniref:hypothetical protein n=1 Tax=Demequina globuliformis TaxID=676202 RepID=UPI0007826D5C|nr:hypothetical protein [Demequina globuliformis]